MAPADTVRDWQSALARSWATEHDDDWATLAVDGHVKVYTGRNGRLPKHFVARQKLCMPASVSYWINALGGTPLLCLHKALDPKLIKAIEQDVVPGPVQASGPARYRLHHLAQELQGRGLAAGGFPHP